MTNTRKKTAKSLRKIQGHGKTIRKRVLNFNLARFIKEHKVTYVVKLKKLPTLSYDITPLKELVKTASEEESKRVGVMILADKSIKVVAGKSSVLLTESALDRFLHELGWDRQRLIEDGVVYSVTYEQNYRHYLRTKEFMRKKAEAMAVETSECGKQAILKAGKWTFNTREELLEKSTASEKAFVKQLPPSVIQEIVLQYPVKANRHKYFIDIYYAPTKVAIEIDGGYHREDKQIAKDRQRDAALLSVGIRTLRLRNADVRSSEVMKYAVEFMLNRKI